MEIKFTVPGAPAGKGRPRFARRGTFVSVYTPEKTVDYENLVKFHARKAMYEKTIMTGPVEMRLLIYMQIPVSWSLKKRIAACSGETLPTIKPDADNVFKLCADALNGIVYTDDKQIADAHISKRYSDMPRVELIIVGA